MAPGKRRSHSATIKPIKERKRRVGNGQGATVTIRLPSELFARVEAVRKRIEPSRFPYFPRWSAAIATAIIEDFLRPLEEGARARDAMTPPEMDSARRR